MKRRIILLVSILTMVALWGAACGSDDDEAATTSTTAADHEEPDADEHDDGEESDGHADFTFGEPAEAADADRVVEVEMSDEFVFVPDEIEVSPGETITFRLHNVGRIPHDFTIGDAATQDDHDAEMMEMAAAGETDMGHSEGNAMTVKAGETMELTWHFTEVEDVLFGCHIPGHYAAGMVGTFVPAA